jgi:hypothetical protein
MTAQTGGEARDEEEKSRHQWKEKGDETWRCWNTVVILIKHFFTSIPLLLLLL